ncbi:MAG: hypothetical protein JNN11_02165 [Candidatus Doudnabacteria bacterium]|nr:hypothetical protein [Candidatus Doudnabacteria bacterium]
MAKAGVRDLAKLGTSEEELQALRDKFYQGVEKRSYENIVFYAGSIKTSLSRSGRFSPNIFSFLLSAVGNYQEALFRQGEQYPETRALTDKLGKDMGLPIALPANPSGQLPHPI